MKLEIDNRTEYLNDYYFQTLCLLYFPGEKFGAGSENGNEARFSVCEETDGDESFFVCEVTLVSGGKSAFSRYSGRGYVPTIPMKKEFFVSNSLGKAFLDAGEKLFGFGLPWGYLTGLRPVKRAKYYLDRGYSPESVETLFTRDYNVFPEKARLSVETALTEEKMLADVGEKDCGLYVSIPFCPTRCDYCSFVSYSNDKLFALIPDYLVRLMQDIRETASLISELGMRVRAIYIGGGTPTMLSYAQLGALLDCINQSIRPGEDVEYTLEGGRPDTLDDEKLLLIKNSGVGRISINTQTTNDHVLERIGRKHSAMQFFDAVERAKKLGFPCMNADIIAGLPGDTFESFAKTLSDMITLGFEDITVHTLSIKNASPIRFIDDGYYDPQGELARASVLTAYNELKGAGYAPYYLYRQKNTVGNAENTGYSRPGKENLYNVLMMEEYSTVFACGAGSITKLVNGKRDDIVRMAYPKYPFEYLRSESNIGREEAIGFFGRDRKEKQN